jgi:hypothetical protein
MTGMPFEPIQIVLNIVGGLLLLVAGVWLRMIQSKVEGVAAKCEECQKVYATREELRRTEDSLREQILDFRTEMRTSFDKVFEKLDKKVDKRK